MMLRTVPTQRLLKWLALIGSLLLSGCGLFGGGDGGKGDALALAGVVSLKIRVADFVNPDVYGRPCPVELRFYQVEDCQAFRQQRFLDLYNQADRFLGSQLLDVHKLYALKPGQVLSLDLPLLKGTKCLAALAGYNQFREGSPTATLAISKTGHARVTLEGLRVVLVRSD